MNQKHSTFLSTALIALCAALCTVSQRADAAPMEFTKQLQVNNTHLIIPVANYPRRSAGNSVRLGIYLNNQRIQNLNVSLPRNDDAYWLASYPLEHFNLREKQISIRSEDPAELGDEYQKALDLIRIGEDVSLQTEDNYEQPYRNQFHVSSRRGWNNDPNGLVYHDGKYHMYYQYNPFGIFWGNMHWGHFVSTDLIHWEQQPIALYQKTVKDMAFSGGGFVDFNNSAGLGKNTQFAAFTSTGRGECLAYSKDGGLTFTELEENPVVEHKGRDPKIIWYEPEKKWVMAVYNNEECEETRTTPLRKGPEVQKRKFANVAFYESRDLRSWNRTGAFTDPDRPAVFECPEFFELPVEGSQGETRWILYGAQNLYFVGHLNGKTFVKESGPHGTRHGAFYAAQTFSDIPDGRRIQIGWVRTASYEKLFPDQVMNQAFTLPHEMTLRNTEDGLRVHFNPVEETKALRRGLLLEVGNLSSEKANALLQMGRGILSEVLIEFENHAQRDIWINGIKAPIEGKSAQIFTDRTFNEVYIDGGRQYEIHTRAPDSFTSTRTGIPTSSDPVKSLKIYRLNSIW